jgi:molybdopterin molybdotransferase
MHVLGVPGNPVSSYVCALLFLVPHIRRKAGRSDLSAASETARLGIDLPANDERMDFLRATLKAGPDGVSIVTPLPVQDSSMMAALARADCLLIREAHAPAAAAGTPCPIVKLRF